MTKDPRIPTNMSEDERREFLADLEAKLRRELLTANNLEEMAAIAKRTIVGAMTEAEAAGKIEIYPMTVGQLREMGCDVPARYPDEWPARIAKEGVQSVPGETPRHLPGLSISFELMPDPDSITITGTFIV
jgi:hypothetical protein